MSWWTKAIGLINALLLMYSSVIIAELYLPQCYSNSLYSCPTDYLGIIIGITFLLGGILWGVLSFVRKMTFANFFLSGLFFVWLSVITIHWNIKYQALSTPDFLWAGIILTGVMSGIMFWAWRSKK